VDQVSKRFRRGQLHDALAGLHSSKSKIVAQSSRIRYSASPDRRFRKGEELYDSQDQLGI
jgi:hypothetical protein